MIIGRVLTSEEANFISLEHSLILLLWTMLYASNKFKRKQTYAKGLLHLEERMLKTTQKGGQID